MAVNKQRLTVTIDPELLGAGHRAVRDGDADSLSAWIGQAIEEKVQRDSRLALLAAAVADFEAEHGEITSDEIASQKRTDRAKATVVRGQPKSA